MSRVVRWLLPYLWGMVAVVACATAKILLGSQVPPATSSPYLLFTVGVMFIASVFGFWPGEFTAIVSTLIAETFFKKYAANIPNQDLFVRIFNFNFQAILICLIGGQLQRATIQRATSYQNEREARERLESTAQALLLSEERYRSAIEVIPQIVFLCNPAFSFEWINDRWSGFTGIKPELALEAGWLDSVHDEDREAVRAEITSALDSGRVITAELRLMSGLERQPRWQLFRAVPVRGGPGGAITQWIGSFTDVHDGRMVMQQVQELNEELEGRVLARTQELSAVNHSLEAANAELEAFCYAVSHDLRTPLRSIDGFSRAVLEDYGDRIPEEGHDFLSRVRAGVKRMDELITALLKLSRIARQELVLQKVDISSMARDAWEDLPSSETANRTFSTMQGLVAQADPKLARVVLDNLLSNAAKFTGNVAEARIEFGQVSTPNGLAFYVRDSGVGFNPDYARKLFLPFERLHSASQYPGSGIGLATVQRSVRKHGGDVWAESKEGSGATFYFTLAPLEPPA